MKVRTQEKHDRISLRTNASQKETLRQAAQAKNMTVSEFVLQSSLLAAQGELDRVHRWHGSREQMDALAAALDTPAREIPELRNLFSKPSVLENNDFGA